MAQRLVLIAIDGSDHSEKAFQCTSSSVVVSVIQGDTDSKMWKSEPRKIVL